MTVMTQLRQVLTETREPAASFADVAARFGKGENVIRKFERGDTAPRYDDIDDFVDAYADAAGVSPLDLWLEAIDRARDGKAKLKRGIGPTDPGAAARAAEEALRPRAPKRQRRAKS